MFRYNLCLIQIILTILRLDLRHYMWENLQMFVLLDQRDGEFLDVLPVRAEIEEDAQATDAGIDGADNVALGHLMIHKVLHHEQGDVIDILDGGDLHEVLQVFGVILDRVRRQVLQAAVSDEFFRCARQFLLTNSVSLFDLLHIARFAPFGTARNLVYSPRSTVSDQ